MITKFNEIKEIGIFKNFNWDNSTPDFTKINIIFGYNGSGKSTISNIFNLFSSKTVTQPLYNNLSNKTGSNIKITLNNHPTEYSSTCNTENIYVFNYNFVKEHVFDGSEANLKKFDSASVTTEQLKNPKIQELENKLRILFAQKEKKQSEKENYEKQFKTIKKQHSDDFNNNIPNSRYSEKGGIEKTTNTHTIGTIKNNLKNTYSNYKISSDTSKIQADLNTLHNISFEQIIYPEKQLIESILTTPLIQSHEELKKKLETFSSLNHEWYKKGLEELKKLEKNDKAKCPLCNSDIKQMIKNLILNYESYFSNEYDDLIKNLNLFKDELEKHRKIILQNNENVQNLTPLFLQYAIESLPFSNLFSPILNKLNIFIELLLYLLNTKIKNPFGDIQIDKIDQNFKSKTPELSKIVDYKTSVNDVLQKLNNLISEHNNIITKANSQKTNLLKKLKNEISVPETYKKEAKELIKQIILKEFDNSNTGDQINKYFAIDHELEELQKKIIPLETEKNKEIANIKNESKYVNVYLKRLGIHHFYIEIINEEKDNIKIYYNSGIQKKGISHSLSEGEKTALAFAYFLSKIKYEIRDANGQELSETIIVIDDPVSSLDDNRLYSTSKLIIDNFIEAKQLFVLSHNLIFLKYFEANIPSSIDIKNKKISIDKEDFFLSIYPEPTFKKLPKALNKYSTVYFSKIKNIQEYIDGKYDYEHAKKFIPNYIRIVIETFLTFKFCILEKEGLKDIINKATCDQKLFNGFKQVKDVTKENFIEKLDNIRKTTNPQSHGTPQSLDDFNFISEQELKQISLDTLNIISFLDQIHYETINKELK